MRPNLWEFHDDAHDDSGKRNEGRPRQRWEKLTRNISWNLIFGSLIVIQLCSISAIEAHNQINWIKTET